MEVQACRAQPALQRQGSLRPRGNRSASIFIPLTSVGGIYGTNFQYMPELCRRWGYPAIWAAMLILGAAMLSCCRRKKWL